MSGDINTGGSDVSNVFTEGVSRRSLPRPAYAKNIRLQTFQDAVDYLSNVFNFDQQSLEGRRMMIAVMDAYRDLPNAKDWSCMKRRGQVVTAASQSTGTIAYDHTGGTYERQVTLSGATFPTNARYYKLRIAGVPHKIEEYRSSTVVTLSEDSNPGSDVAASTSYEMFRSTYPLPPDFRSESCLLHLGELGWQPIRVSSADLVRLESSHVAAFDRPSAYSIRNSDDEYGVMVVEFGPPPSTQRVYDVLYKASPREIEAFGQDAEYSTGTVSVSGTTVTGSGTAFSQRMVGCVIRFTTSATVPTGSVGRANNYMPYEEQRIITSVSDATSLEIDTVVDGTYSDNKFSIGDPLDFDDRVLMTPFLKLAEAYMKRHGSSEGAEPAMAEYYRVLKEAMGADNRSSSPLSGVYRSPSLIGMNHNLLTGSEGV